MRKRGKVTLATHLRSIADLLERDGFRNFPIYIRAAAREMSEMNYELKTLKRRVARLEKAR